MIVVKEKNFLEWVNDFVTINLGLMCLLMILVPVFKWWIFLFLALISKFAGPQIIDKIKKSHKSRTRF
jgi:hypothetical protein